MSGRKSKSKGYRNEILLRDILRKEGYIADRVPLSGSMKGYKGDVNFYTPGGLQYTAEVKSRKDAFKRIYEMVESMKGRDSGFIYDPGAGLPERLFYITYSMKKAIESRPWYYELVDAKYNRTLRKVANMRPLMQKCDVLCVKDDRKPFLFIRYLD